MQYRQSVQIIDVSSMVGSHLSGRYGMMAGMDNAVEAFKTGTLVVGLAIALGMAMYAAVNADLGLLALSVGGGLGAGYALFDNANPRA